jgi:hypothetical protein
MELNIKVNKWVNNPLLVRRLLKMKGKIDDDMYGHFSGKIPINKKKFLIVNMYKFAGRDKADLSLCIATEKKGILEYKNNFVDTYFNKS